jgi:hypothetical protein
MSKVDHEIFFPCYSLRYWRWELQMLGPRAARLAQDGVVCISSTASLCEARARTPAHQQTLYLNLSMKMAILSFNTIVAILCFIFWIDRPKICHNKHSLRIRPPNSLGLCYINVTHLHQISYKKCLKRLDQYFFLSQKAKSGTAITVVGAAGARHAGIFILR